MNNTFPNRNKKKNTAAYIVSAIISLVCIAGLSVFFFYMGQKNNTVTEAQNNENSINTSVQISGQREMRGAWIATAININFPSKSALSEKQLKSELDTILENASSVGLNTLFFQVRPTADALYKSDIFPASKYVSGENGKAPDNDFDCLAYLLEQSKKYNIDIHAWINPYRVTMYESDEAGLSKNSPAVLCPEYTVKYADGKTYFNPGLPEVRELVVSGVSELVTNYPDLSGIHFDDYFYPYPVGEAEFDDADAYSKYSNGESLADWRRNNVNMLIEQTYKTVKAINPELRFGVSVFGIWANQNNTETYVKGSNTNGLEAYSELYCDALAWAKGGYVDYIAPQDYWSFDTSAAPFDNVARWWNANLDGTGVDLYIGHAAYKANEFEEGEIALQVEFCRSLLTYKGSIFYGFSELCNNDGDNKTRLCKLYESQKYFTLPKSTGQAPVISFPGKDSAVTTANTYILGSSDAAMSPVIIDNAPVSRTKEGYFSTYMPIANNQKQITLSQDGTDYSHAINTVYAKTSPYTYKTMQTFEIGETYPQDSMWLNVGDTLKLGCAAPAGSIVTATIGGMTVKLNPTINPPSESAIMYEYYTGSVTPSTFAKDGEVVTLGTLVFEAQNADQKASKEVCLISQAGKDAYCFVEVNEDYTHTKVGTTTSFYDDFLPSSKGMRDYAVALKDGFYKLSFGGYVSEDKVTLNSGRMLNENKLLSARVEVSCTDTSNNDNNSTDIRIGITENIPVDVDFREGFMRLIIYNTDTSYIPEFEIDKNPLIESIKGGKGTKPGMVIYKVKLKDDKNFYGFNIVYENGMLIFKLNNPQTLYNSEAKPLTGKTIVVDAGHGGTDIGAPGPGNKPEAVLNYEIASRLAQNLRALGANVLETRGKDQTSNLYERMDFLNAACPDLAVSVHHNSVPANANAQKSRGFVALYSNNSGVLLAETVSRTVCKSLNRLERQYYYDQLAVARNHRFPSALFEMCFISNVEEYQWSISEGNYDRSAQALTDGILDYYAAQEAYLEY